MMDKVCHQVLLNESQASIRHAHVAFIAEYKKTFPNCQEGQWPSYAQFYWFYRHNYSVAERNLKRLGKITYAKNNRPLHGSASDIAGNLGGLYLIDATEADAYICSEEDRKPIGRPWYYIVIDVATGMIASIFVSLESPQFDMSCKALYMAIADKKPFLQNLGLADKCHWDISGIPAAVMSDNAELQSDRLQDFLRNYHVSNSFHPAYRADCKGLVEMVFNIINKELAPEINATPDKIESHKAGHQEKRHLASLTLNEFQKLVVCAAMVANCRTRDNTPKNYPKGRSNTPELIMEWAKDTGRNELIHPGNLELTRIMLMPRGTPSFSEHGVTFDKITWTCAEARRLGLFERKAARTSTSGYTLAYDRDNVSYAWLFPDIQHKPEIYWECSLAPRSDHLAGMTKSQAQAFISQNNAANKVARNQRDNFAADVYIEIKKTVKEAEAKKQAQPSTGQTRAEIIKDIKENRSQETIVQAQKRHEVFSCKNSIAQEQNSTDKKKKKLYPERTIYPDSIDDLPD